VRRPEGWTALRQTLGSAARAEVAQLAADRLAPHLGGASADAQRFVAALFAVPPGLTTVRELARAVGVLPTTMMSRFFRSRLPAPKRYLAMARLTRAADLLAYGAWTVASMADYMDYSSAQGFSRHLHLLLGVRPAEFRRRFTPELLLDRFAEELLIPHAAALREFWLWRR
jgi:transcriptional regulator GlxA family with amidase domain